MILRREGEQPVNAFFEFWPTLEKDLVKEVTVTDGVVEYGIATESHSAKILAFLRVCFGPKQRATLRVIAINEQGGQRKLICDRSGTVELNQCSHARRFNFGGFLEDRPSPSSTTIIVAVNMVEALIVPCPDAKRHYVEAVFETICSFYRGRIDRLSNLESHDALG